mmetsp:Transcript_2858/g.4572  ORF Transcript_2858/g.4572 Transcript_2858/m.4572 type:complete len:256 (-) Transcript_2858:892-1659(-)
MKKRNKRRYSKMRLLSTLLSSRVCLLPMSMARSPWQHTTRGGAIVLPNIRASCREAGEGWLKKAKHLHARLLVHTQQQQLQHHHRLPPLPQHRTHCMSQQQMGTREREGGGQSGRAFDEPIIRASHGRLKSAKILCPLCAGCHCWQRRAEQTAIQSSASTNSTATTAFSTTSNLLDSATTKLARATVCALPLGRLKRGGHWELLTTSGAPSSRPRAHLALGAPYRHSAIQARLSMKSTHSCPRLPRKRIPSSGCA